MSPRSASSSNLGREHAMSRVMSHSDLSDADTVEHRDYKVSNGTDGAAVADECKERSRCGEGSVWLAGES